MTSGVRLTKPGRGHLDRFLERAERKPLSYQPIGMTAGPVPDRYRVSRRSVELGRGDSAFEQAATAIRSWSMFDIPWVRVYPDAPVIRPGLTVVVAARSGGLWTLNPTRVVQVIDEPRISGLAYGTVEGHAASGEERFEVVLETDGTVRYRITAYSQLRHPLARMIPPVARRVQARFAAASLQAMERAMQNRHSTD